MSLITSESGLFIKAGLPYVSNTKKNCVVSQLNDKTVMQNVNNLFCILVKIFVKCHLSFRHGNAIII